MSAVLTLLTVTLDDQPLASPISARFGAQGGVLGRSEQCDLVLPDPERFISRRQAELHFVDGGFVIRNIGSGNPILVAGLAVARGDEAKLAHGDEVRVGGYELRAHLVGVGAGAAAPAQATSSKAGALSRPSVDAASQQLHLASGLRRQEAHLADSERPASGGLPASASRSGAGLDSGSAGPPSAAISPPGAFLAPARVSVQSAPAWPPPTPWIEDAFDAESGAWPLPASLASSVAAQSTSGGELPKLGPASSVGANRHAPFQGSPPLGLDSPQPAAAATAPLSSMSATAAAPVQPVVATAFDGGKPTQDAQALWAALCEGLGVDLQWPGANAQARMRMLGKLLRGSVSSALSAEQGSAPTPGQTVATSNKAAPSKSSADKTALPAQDNTHLAATVISLLEQGQARFSSKPNSGAMSLEAALLQGRSEGGLVAALAAALQCYEPSQLQLHLGKTGSAKAWLPGAGDAHAWREYVRQHPQLKLRAQEAFAASQSNSLSASAGPQSTNAPASATAGGAVLERAKPPA